jgi:hypothetical protein
MAIVNDFPKNAEYFRAIDGFPDYEVSSDGQVRNCKSGRMMKPAISRGGYLRVGIRNDNKPSFHLIHRLVAGAFCNKGVDCDVVDHIDRNTTNNNYQNLRWTTISGNQRNKSMSAKNTSGHQGVFFTNPKKCWVAFWYDINQKQQNKNFSVKKYGEHAKQMAIDYRHMMADTNNYLNV